MSTRPRIPANRPPTWPRAWPRPRARRSPGAPITADQWALLKAGSAAGGKLPGLKAFGIVPRPLGLFLDRWMVRYRKHGRFGGKTAKSA
jgi:hypothetical protein